MLSPIYPEAVGNRPTQANHSGEGPFDWQGIAFAKELDVQQCERIVDVGGVGSVTVLGSLH